MNPTQAHHNVLYSRELCEGHDFHHVNFDYHQIKAQPLDLEKSKEKFLSTNKYWQGFYRYDVDPHKLHPKDAHFYLINGTHPLKAENDHVAILNDFDPDQLKDQLTEQEALVFIDWLSTVENQNYYNSIEQHLYLLLMRLCDHGFLLEKMQQNLSTDKLIVLLPYIDHTYKQEVLRIAVEHQNTLNKNQWKWQLVLIVMEYHPDVDNILNFFKTHKGGFDTMREALLTRHLPKENFMEIVYGPERLVPYCSALICHHMHTFGFERFDLILEKLALMTTDCLSCVFGIHHIDIVPFILAHAMSKDHAMASKAHKWLKTEGANAIVGLAPFLESKVFSELCHTIFVHYIRSGHAELVLDLLEKEHPQALPKIKEIIAAENVGGDEAITIPPWFEYWSRRGIKMDKRGHHLFIALPKLQTVDDQWLTSKLQDSLLRLFQDHKKQRAQAALTGLSTWLNEDSCKTLVSYLLDLWRTHDFTRGMNWVLDVAPLVHQQHFIECAPNLLKILRISIEEAGWDTYVQSIRKEARIKISDTLLSFNTPEADLWVFWSAAMFDAKALQDVYETFGPTGDKDNDEAQERLEAALGRYIKIDEAIELTATYIQLLENQHHEHNAEHWINSVKNMRWTMRWRCNFLWHAQHNDVSIVFRLDEDGSLLNHLDEDVEIDPSSKIRLAQIADVPKNLHRAWGKIFVEHDIILLHDIFDPKVTQDPDDIQF